MNTPLRWTLRFVVLAGALATALALAPRAYAGGVVGNGTPASCTEAALSVAMAGGGNVTFNCGGPVTIQISAPRSIGPDTAINGSGAVTLSAHLTYLFAVNSGHALTLTNITLANGYSSVAGSIVNTGTTTIEHSTFVHNQSSAFGGAISNFGTLNIASTDFYTNSAAFAGGAIYNNGGAVSMIGSEAWSNTVFGLNGAGGAIANDAGDITMTLSTLTGNVSDQGGGVFNESGAGVFVVSSTIKNNIATFGGGVENRGVFHSANSVVASNSASHDGGGILTFGQVYLWETTVNDNLAGGTGGGISNAGTVISVTASTVSNNTSLGNGGGIYTMGSGQFVNSTISGNVASGSNDGGGIFQGPGVAFLHSNTIVNNRAAFGGGILSNGSTSVGNTLLSNNSPGNNCYGTLTSLGHNISSDTSCAGPFTQPGDRNNIGTVLGALTNNGGPTQTHMPLHGSPAIDNGSTVGCPLFDQRGVSRPLGAACDVGAVESNRGHQISLPVLVDQAALPAPRY